MNKPGSLFIKENITTTMTFCFLQNTWPIVLNLYSSVAQQIQNIETIHKYCE